MIGIGIVGYGYWGPNLVRNFSEAAGSEVLCVCDLSPQRRQLASQRHPHVQVTGSYDELLSNPRVGAVVVATPVASHFGLAQKALAAGKHILVEKPLALNTQEATHLVEEADRRGLVLMVDHTFVYTGAVAKIRELVTTGALGKLYYYDSVRVNLGLFQHDINVIWDLAVHDLSIMDHVVGLEPVAVSATGASHLPGKPEDVAFLTCFFADNFIAHVHVNWLAPVKVRRTLIGGDQKMIVYDDLEPSEKIKVYDRGVTLSNGAEGVYQTLVGYRTGDMWAPQIQGNEALAVMSRHFLDCIVQGREPITSGRVGLRIVRVLEAASRSLALKGASVDIGAA